MQMKIRFLFLLATLLLTSFFVTVSLQESFAQSAKSYQYGNIIMRDSASVDSGGTVVFRHWSHRSKYSCRLCHVDLEFSQIAGDSGITEDDNQSGRFCGTCHNGKEAFTIKLCAKCHAQDEKQLQEILKADKKAFFAFQKTMPRSSYGNKIDWMKAEQDGLIQLKDKLPGISPVQMNFVTNQRNEPLEPQLSGLPGIIFSHQKHVAWNGCGMCHPEPFKLVNGTTEMNMQEIIAGQYCGRCHGTVAFQINDCALCHSKPVSL
ncbi:MAG: hypothetical protein C0622_12095 [Desulfuromonas sp.]|nr:MAG: hypothetical protein C0622_12095 [Desulfuromonas sp.]